MIEDDERRRVTGAQLTQLRFDGAQRCLELAAVHGQGTIDDEREVGRRALDLDVAHGLFHAVLPHAQVRGPQGTR